MSLPITIAPANRKYFVDVFENWVANVRRDYDPIIEGIGNAKPYSYYGSVTEITNYLVEKSSDPISSRQKFPFICLVDNFTENHVSNDSFYDVRNATFYIFNETLEEYEPTARYTNVIKPVLYPICDLFLNYIEFGDGKSPVNGALSFTKETFRGQIGENVQVSDTVDCIKLTFNSLKIKKYC